MEDLIWVSLIVICILIWLWEQFHKIKKIDFNGKHVYITGGSCGIGLCVAEEVVKSGGKVTISARNQHKLDEAKNHLIELSTDKDCVLTQSFDIGKSDSELVENMIDLAEDSMGPIDTLVNCAGYSIPLEFSELKYSDVKQMMSVNYLGSFLMTQIVVKKMKNNGMKGCIIFVSSLAGLFGFYGFSAYSASKAAVCKLAEAVHQEVKPFGISVTVALPPDTDTPGFQQEQLTKPVECMNISDGGGLSQPDEVARSILLDTLNGKFYSYIGFNGFLLTTLCADLTPVTSLVDLFFQVVFGGLFRVIAAILLFTYDRMIKQEHLKKMNKKEN